MDPYTGRCHATWLLKDPVCTYKGALTKPIGTLGLVRYWLNMALKGDQAYINQLTKNPWYIGQGATITRSAEFPTIQEAQQASNSRVRWHTIIMNPYQ